MIFVSQGGAPDWLEKVILRDIVDLLRAVPESWVVKLRGSKAQKRGLPDLLFTCAALRGRMIWFEVKRPSGKLSGSQELVLDELGRAGAIRYVVDSPLSVLRVLDWEGAI